MSDIELAFDWLDADGAQGPELRATWAKFTLRVAGDTVTRVVDSQSRTTRDHVYLPLYPLAEWLAAHWWALFYEVDTPRKDGDRAFAMRHSLRDAREGYALPALSILPQGETVRLVWEQETLPHQRIEFLTRGQKDLPTPALQTELADLIRAVVRRLQELQVEGTPLEEEWGAIESEAGEEREFCSVAAALGLDPYALEEDQRREIALIGGNIPASLRFEFFSVASMDFLGEESKTILEALEVSRTNQADLRTIKEIRSELLTARRPAPSVPPWEVGYATAREIRNYLDLDSQPLPSLAAISNAVRINQSELEKAIRQTAAPTPLFDALVGLNEKGSPGFVVSSRREESRRFHLCRGFFEYLTCANLEAALLTDAKSDRQARSRAFAAEFLAPAEGLRTHASGKTVSGDEVADLAGRFGVSPWVIAHQLENQQIARVVV